VAQAAAIDGHRLDHGVDGASRQQAETVKRQASDAGEQRLAIEIQPNVCARTLGGAYLDDAAGQDIERAQSLRPLDRQHDVPGVDAHADSRAHPDVEPGYAQ
jgi:hypothetical protein